MHASGRTDLSHAGVNFPISLASDFQFAQDFVVIDTLGDEDMEKRGELEWLQR